MKNKGTLIVVVALLAAAGAAMLLTRRGEGPTVPPSPPTAQEGGVYCSSDGTLTDTMPIQSHRSYCLLSDAGGKTYPVAAPMPYAFSVVDDRGETLKDFAVTHTKTMHVIVVRKDLASFRHLHPVFDPATGRFTLPDLMFPSDGPYRVFADFVPAGGMMGPMGEPLGVTVWEDVAAGSAAAYLPEPLGSEARSKDFDGLQVKLTPDRPLKAGEEITLTFDLRADGKPVTDLQEYLGALGHSVILREGTLDFLHTHPESADRPQDGTVDFVAAFPEAGEYKVFTQFQKDGKVVTTDFVLSVAPGNGEAGSMMGH